MKLKRKAFTLIELLLVAVLLIVVAGFSIPNLAKAYSGVQFRAASRQISYLMRYAQSVAVIHQKEYRICFAQDRLNYWLEEEVKAEGDEDQETLSTEKSFQKIKGEKGRVFSMTSGISLEVQNDNIVFYPDATIDKAEIILRNKDQKEIVISTQERRGQIDVFSPTE